MVRRQTANLLFVGSIPTGASELQLEAKSRKLKDECEVQNCRAGAVALSGDRAGAAVTAHQFVIRTCAVPLRPSMVAVIVTVPVRRAVTSPVSDTVAR